MSIAEQIGQRIRSIRESKDLTIEEVVKRCGVSKPLVSKSLISQLETKNTDVSLRRLEALAQALAISLPDLVNEKLSTEHIISSAELDAFCEQDKIDAQDKAHLKDLLDKGIVSFQTAKDWGDYYRGRKYEQARRPSLAPVPRVADSPQTYKAQRKPTGSRRRKPQKSK